MKLKISCILIQYVPKLTTKMTSFRMYGVLKRKFNSEINLYNFYPLLYKDPKIKSNYKLFFKVAVNITFKIIFIFEE